MAVDYSHRIRCSEEVVVGIIDDILVEGGHMLWQKYLVRKAFPFATETVTDNIVSNLQLCFVAHDRGEIAQEPEDWDLEAEPVPGAVDSWARMHLDVRRQRSKTEELPRPQRADRRFNSQRTRVSDALRRANANDKHDKKDEKTFILREEQQMDDEEEKLRNARMEEEAKRRERENKVRANEKAKELEVQRVQALHEEMSKKTHTFDSDGGLIWVEEVKFDRLPKVQEIFGYQVKRDAKDKRLEATAAPAPKAKAAATQRRRLRFGESRKKEAVEDDFPDSFSKLQHGQPPILETMVVKPGVVLESSGKNKAGPAVNQTGGGMSRKDYVAMSEREVAFEAQFASMSDPSKAGSIEGAPDSLGGFASPPGSRGLFRSETSPGAPGAAEGGDASLGSTLPPIGGALGGSGPKRGGPPGSRGGMARGGMGSTGSMGKQGDDGERKECQTAPTAPSQFVRGKKMEAVGHLGRHPRLHIAPLGGPYGAVAQPPLGATMGHGLMRAGSSKESYWFPPNSPIPIPLLRATSDSAIGPRSGRRTPLPLSNRGGRDDSRLNTAEPGGRSHRSNRSRDDEDSPRHGQIKVDKKSQAYRGMRQTLFPNTLSSLGLSGTVY